MGYESTSIKKVIKDIESSKIYLPALQRKFVWGKPQIQMLFDSLMRNYPIGTFLFWKLHKDKADTYVFYEFLKKYDQRTPYNERKTGSFLHPEITGILDGQQRLSSIYIGLQGTHTEKAPYKRILTDNAYNKTSLFLNILSLPYVLTETNSLVIDEEKNFEFRFLTERESLHWNTRKIKFVDNDGNEGEKDEFMFWFKVGDVLRWDDDPEYEVIIDNFINSCQIDSQKEEMKSIPKKRIIRKGLETLFLRITRDELINYFEVTKNELEDILKIFVRVNSGGTQLNKTDLLFSTIVATWDNGREEIEDLLKKINNKGEKFNFTNEYLMRCCLVLTDSSVVYKVNSFKSENVQKIKDEWDKISDSIIKTVDLLVEFGFNESFLTSQNATTIIAYYIIKGGEININTKKEIKKYLIHSLLNGIYGSSTDQVITVFRNAFREESRTESGNIEYLPKMQSFSFDELLKVTLPSRKSLYVTDAEIEKFLTYKKGSASFFVLSLLYPNLRYNEVQFHQDHIHPFSRFSSQIFEEMRISEEEKIKWLNYRDMIPNLQLLEGRQNESKNATEFKRWISTKNSEEIDNFCITNYIPREIDFEFSNFLLFFENRKNKLKEELKRVLAINNEIHLPEEEFIQDDEELEIENGILIEM